MPRLVMWRHYWKTVVVNASEHERIVNIKIVITSNDSTMFK
jgi:hypothetical protein